ncbi:YL1 nuclear protein-domain-containing protein, partial [Aspergillus aurantiobrunneus]
MSEDEGRTSFSEDEVPVESLIKGREKRSTAGRQMSALLDAEADDELALLFEEVDDDNEFAADAAEEGGEDDDMGLNSSSDDEDDQGPNAQADDLEGERQIQKEEKEEKKKKRAREDLRYRITSKKVKIDPTAVPKAPTTTASRPRKKSERVSWIPTPDEGPTRSSSRRQTMHNKELTHARLKDSEQKRVRLIATMEEAAKKKAKHKPKEMTQAERLAEAERVEKHNSKSLNRWEEMEKRKAEERRAKIEALQNRRLEGPVISYWSGVATWADGRLTRVGKVTITPKPEKEDGARKKSKKTDKEGKNDTERKPSNAITGPDISHVEVPVTPSENPALPTTKPEHDQPLIQSAQPTATDSSHAIDTTSKRDHPEHKGEASIASSQPIIPTNAAPEAELPASAPSTLPESDTAASVTKANAEETGGTQAAREQMAKSTDDETTENTVDRPTIHNAASQPDEASAVKDSKNPGTETPPKVEEKPSDVALEPTAEPQTNQLAPEPASTLSASNAPDTNLLDGQLDGQLDEQKSTEVPMQI